MRVTFMGCRRLGLTAIRALVRAGHDVALVATQDEAAGRAEGPSVPSVSAFARGHGLNVVQFRGDVDPAFVRANAGLAPDIVISANWPKLIGRAVLDHARHGGINVHRSLLPAYGGLDPICWAVANGETVSGVTIHELGERIDLGDIILQHAFPIAEWETAFDAHRKSLKLVAEMLPEALRRIESGGADRTPQDPAQLKLFPRRTERHLRIDWRARGVDIHNLIRAQADPFPNAFGMISGTKLRINRASLAAGSYRGAAGSIVERAADGVTVICGADGGSARSGLLVREVREGGEAPMCAADHRLLRAHAFDVM